MSQVKIRVQTLAVEQKVTHYLGLSAEVNCNYLVTMFMHAAYKIIAQISRFLSGGLLRSIFFHFEVV